MLLIKETKPNQPLVVIFPFTFPCKDMTFGSILQWLLQVFIFGKPLYIHTGPFAMCVDCSLMARETGVQSQVE